MVTVSVVISPFIIRQECMIELNNPGCTILLHPSSDQHQSVGLLPTSQSPISN